MEAAPDHILAVESGAEVLATHIGPLLLDIMHLSGVGLITPGILGVTKDLVFRLIAVAKSNYYVSIRQALVKYFNKRKILLLVSLDLFDFDLKVEDVALSLEADGLVRQQSLKQKNY